MANYEALKAAIMNVVRTNGSQLITGANLQAVLIAMLNASKEDATTFDDEINNLTEKLDTNRFGYNVSVFGTVAGIHTLSTAVVNVPASERFAGQKITFKTDAGWVTYQNTSLSTDNYENVSNWVLDSGVTVEGDVSITNNPDYEDLTQNNSNQLKFADKEYNASTFTGLGRIYLRKNIVSNVNTLTQAMLADANTIYIIQYDYTLGADITIPANCVLKFDGGSISASGNNDTITGNKTSIDAGLQNIFNSGVIFAGTWNVGEIYPEWFGAVSGSDSTAAIQKCINNALAVGIKDVKLSNTYLVSAPIVINEKINIFGTCDKYSKDNLVAADNFTGQTLNGYLCNAILECRRPILLSRVGINGSAVANGIQWYEGFAEGSIAKCYFHNCRSAAIIGSVVESFTIEDNYISATPIGIRFTNTAFTDTGQTIFRPQTSNKHIGGGYMFYINRNVVQAYGIGILLQGMHDVSIFQNMTAHCQLNGIWCKDCISLSIINCYSEGDGVCVGDGYTPVSGTQPAISTSQTLIDNNLDGYVYDGNAYRSPYFVATTHEFLMEHCYVSYKKRGQSKTIEEVSTNRSDAGVDAILTTDTIYEISINDTFYGNWNNSYASEATIFDVNMFTAELYSVNIDTKNPQPFAMINANIGNVGKGNYFYTRRGDTSVLDGDDNSYYTSLYYSPSVYTMALTDMPITLVEKIGTENFYKFNEATSQMHFCIKNPQSILLIPKTYIMVLIPVKSNSTTTTLNILATCYGGGTKTFSFSNSIMPNKFYYHRAFIPIDANMTNIDIGVSLERGTDNDNVLFGKLRAVYISSSIN